MSGSNSFIPTAIGIVKHAIDADQRGEYEEALPLYRRALEHFMIGLKYETNPTGLYWAQVSIPIYSKRVRSL